MNRFHWFIKNAVGINIMEHMTTVPELSQSNLILNWTTVTLTLNCSEPNFYSVVSLCVEPNWNLTAALQRRVFIYSYAFWCNSQPKICKSVKVLLACIKRQYATFYDFFPECRFCPYCKNSNSNARNLGRQYMPPLASDKIRLLFRVTMLITLLMQYQSIS